VRILHIGTGYTSVNINSKRSVETSIYHMATKQRMLGHDVSIQDRDTWISGGNPITYLAKVILFCFLISPGLAIGLLRNKWQVIHTHSQFPAALVICLKWCTKCKAPIFYTLHNPYLVTPKNLRDRLIHTLIEGWVLRRVDRVVAQTKSVGDMVAGIYRLDAGKVVQVFAGVDVRHLNTVRKHNMIDTWHNIILYPAVVTERKNQGVIIGALAEVIKEVPDCEVVFAGLIERAQFYQQLQMAAKWLKVEHKIRWLGHISHEDLYEWYAKAGVVVFPSTNETQGLVPLEAMALGVPVIASKIPVIVDVANLGDEGCMILCDPDNVHEWSAAILRVLQSRTLRYYMMLRGFKLVKEEFDWLILAQQMTGEYLDAQRVSE